MIVTYNPVVTGTVAEPETLQDYREYFDNIFSIEIYGHKSVL